jgi:hypothetical protein
VLLPKQWSVEVQLRGVWPEDDGIAMKGFQELRGTCSRIQFCGQSGRFAVVEVQHPFMEQLSQANGYKIEPYVELQEVSGVLPCAALDKER